MSEMHFPITAFDPKEDEINCKILERAADVLKSQFPEYASKVEFRIPDEKSRRHGQAMAAASLPMI